MPYPDCFECHGSGSCDCITCGREAIGGGWQSGPCVVCKGRAEMDALRPRLDRAGVDPRDPKYWKRIGKKRDQSAPKLVFDPFNEV